MKELLAQIAIEIKVEILEMEIMPDHVHLLNDYRRALNTLRYIHANPKASGMRAGFFYDFSNYGTHDRLTEDGLTQWHPAFLSLGKSLEECAAKYRGFCKRYRPQPKQEKSYHWGSKLHSPY